MLKRVLCGETREGEINRDDKWSKLERNDAIKITSPTGQFSANQEF